MVNKHNDIEEQELNNLSNTPETTISQLTTNTYRYKEKSHFLSVLKLRNFMIFSLSQAISLFGDKLDYMALLAMIAFYSEQYGWQSARAISYLSVIITLPTILLGPLAGVLVDRWNRLKVLIFCDSCRAIMVFLIPLIVIRTGSLYLVYSIAFLVFLFGLFFNTARLSIIPNLVAKRRLLAANSFMNFVGRISTFLGMFLGGLIVDWQAWHKIGIKYSWSAGFYLDALTYCFSVLGLILIAMRTNVFGQKFLQAEELRSAKKIPDFRPLISSAHIQEKKTIEELKLAFKYISRTPKVLFVFATIFLLVIIGATAFVLLVPLIQSANTNLGFGVGTKGVGFVAAAGAVGLVLSSMSFGLIGHRTNKQYMIISAFLLLGIITILIPSLNSFIALLPLAFGAGLLISPIFIIQDTILHETVPDGVRGRIFSAREWLLHLSFGLACLIVGELTNFFSNQHLMYFTGTLVVIISIIGLFLIKKGYTNRTLR
ncbi:MAG: MFS transporter [candidate division WOR-3 bacterium]|nr:MFS transporter [candidate division WOR-3 bacterium]